MTARSLQQTVSNRCGYGNYFAVGTHGYNPFYGPRADYTSTFQTLTPLAWND